VWSFIANKPGPRTFCPERRRLRIVATCGGVLQRPSRTDARRSGQLPMSGDYAYEVKWAGFRAIVSTEGPLRVRSRRGWDMTPHVGFLAQLPTSVSRRMSSGLFAGSMRGTAPYGVSDGLFRATQPRPFGVHAFLLAEGVNCVGFVRAGFAAGAVPAGLCTGCVDARRGHEWRAPRRQRYLGSRLGAVT
jgi:hypothetical protein